VAGHVLQLADGCPAYLPRAGPSLGGPLSCSEEHVQWYATQWPISGYMQLTCVNCMRLAFLCTHLAQLADTQHMVDMSPAWPLKLAGAQMRAVLASLLDAVRDAARTSPVWRPAVDSMLRSCAAGAAQQQSVLACTYTVHVLMLHHVSSKP
jgi:hypothetical protein